MARQWLIHHGFWVIQKDGWGAADVRREAAELIKPFAEAHIVSGRWGVDSESAHAVVTDHAGKVFDPSGRAEADTDVAAHFYEVGLVLGVFKV